MTNSRSTKRALYSSVIALIICFAMLIGTTYAWFTDSATSANNVIKTGTLDVELYQWNGVVTDDRANAVAMGTESPAVFPSDIKWEPGYTHVVYLSIKNNGDLSLKYKVALEVTQVSDKSLLDVMSYAVSPDAQFGSVTSWAGNGTYLQGTYTEDAKAQDVELKPGDEHFFALSVHMDEDAGNEYMNQSVTFDVIVLAAQVAHEEDGLGSDDYDADAGYVDTYANNEASLAEALANGGAVALTADVAVSNVLTVAADTTIYLNGHDLDASANTSRPFNVADGVKLTINAEGAEIKAGKYGFVNVPAGNDATVVINGGNFTANTDNGSFIKARGTGNIVVTLNNVNYVDASANGGWIANAVESSIGNFELNINGGTFEAYNGFSGVEKLSVKNATVKVKHNGVYNSWGEAVVDGCTIICTNEGTTQEQSAAPASCVAVSSNCTVTVKNSTLISENGEATAVYTSGGTMALENCTVTGAYAHYVTGKYADAQFATTVDGVAANVVVH